MTDERTDRRTETAGYIQEQKMKRRTNRSKQDTCSGKRPRHANRQKATCKTIRSVDGTSSRPDQLEALENISGVFMVKASLMDASKNTSSPSQNIINTTLNARPWTVVAAALSWKVFMLLQQPRNSAYIICTAFFSSLSFLPWQNCLPAWSLWATNTEREKKV